MISWRPHILLTFRSSFLFKSWTEAEQPSMIKCPIKMRKQADLTLCLRTCFSIPLIAWLNLSHAWKSQREEPMPGWRFTAQKKHWWSYYLLDMHSYGSHKRKQLLEQWNVWNHDARDANWTGFRFSRHVSVLRFSVREVCGLQICAGSAATSS